MKIINFDEKMFDDTDYVINYVMQSYCPYNTLQSITEYNIMAAIKRQVQYYELLFKRSDIDNDTKYILNKLITKCNEIIKQFNNGENEIIQKLKAYAECHSGFEEPWYTRI